MDTLSTSNRNRKPRWNNALELLSTIALALLLGLVVWLVAINQENPLVSTSFPEPIPIAVRGLDESLAPLQDLSDETVRVVVKAPRNSWDNLKVDDFNAYIDLSGLAEGIHDVDVRVDVVDPTVDIQDVQRPQLRVQLDRTVDKLVPVRAEIMDNTAFGYDWQTPIVEPISVTVRGPSTQVDQVVSVRSEVYLRNAKSQIERTLAMAPQNSQGQLVARVTTNPGQVRVVVPVEQWPGRKEVAVRVNLEGQPASGYRLSTVRVNPSTVVLLGNADLLAQLPGFVETTPITLTDATTELQRRVELVLPEEVTVLEGDTVLVTASIAAIEGGTTVKQKPVIQGLNNGLNASVDLETVDVILSGPLTLLESLGPDDIFVILDLNGLLPGNHIVTPRVVVPDGIRSEGVLPETIEVVVLEPEPEALATPESDGAGDPMPPSPTEEAGTPPPESNQQP
ncbi:MAG: hypothetical protein HC802_07905 [Caldilineaceae bacterium]|nr:hypothetical protein [Caldilineaceae bacterium]